MTYPQGTAAALVAVALAEVGNLEKGDNLTKYGEFTGANGLPWCGSFVNWCANEAGVKIPNMVGTAAGAQKMKDLGRWQTVPKVGDLCFMDFPNDNLDRISHVGIVVKDNGDGTVTTIEGNTAADKKGDQRNGGECCVKIRAFKKSNGGKLRKSQTVSIVGFGKPKFKE